MKIKRARPHPILSLEIPKELKYEAQEIAKAYGLTLSAFTRMLLSQSVREHQTTKQ